MADEDAPPPRVRIDYESGERVYLQIVRIIRDMIISGELPVGDADPERHADAGTNGESTG